MDALARDLGVTGEQAEARLVNEAAAAGVDPGLRALLGPSYAGTWVTGPTATPVAATTDPSKTAAIAAAGVAARVVSRSLDRLDQVKATLERLRRARRLGRLVRLRRPGPGRHLRRLGQLRLRRDDVLPAGQRDPGHVRADPGHPGGGPTGSPTVTPTDPGGTWAPNTAYATGATVTYGGTTYRCLQGHTSQAGWEPPNVPALWQRV